MKGKKCNPDGTRYYRAAFRTVSDDIQYEVYIDRSLDSATEYARTLAGTRTLIDVQEYQDLITAMTY